MEERDRYLFLEFLFTFFLLVSLIFLFGDTLLPYRVYLTLGLAAGFSFGWLNRNNQSFLSGFLVNLAVLGIFGWIVYSLVNSSLIYKEVILTFIKGGIILELIFSFNSCSPPYLAYTQALSLPLLMCFPAVVKEYKETQAILALIYMICWMLILKVKFYKSFKPVKERKSKKHLPIIVSTILFLIIIFVSWQLFYRLSLGKIEKGGVLLEENKEGEIDIDALEKEYYGLQDIIQKDVSKLIAESVSNEDKHQMLILLGTLIKDFSSVMEAEKAEEALITRIKAPGPGLEKAGSENMVAHFKNYLDKKTQLTLWNLRESISKKTKKKGFNMLERISIMNKLNKMQHSGSYKEIKKYERELNRSINYSSAKENAKKDLKENAKQFKEWKVWELYRKKLESLNKKADSLDKQSRKELADLISQINKTDKLPEFQEAKEKIDRLKKTTPAPLDKETLKEAEELLELKLEMFLLEKERELKQKKEALEQADIKEREEVRKFLEETKSMPEEEAEKPIDALKDYLDSKKQEEPEQKDTPQEIKDSQQKGKGKGTEKSKDDSGNETKKLKLIKIVPDFLQVAAGETGQFTALGIYSDDSQDDLTQTGDWSSSNDKVAKVSAGKVDTFFPGEAKIYVKSQGVESLPALVKVEGPKLVSINISPQDLRMSMRKNLTLKAEGKFSDSSKKDITSLVSWEIANTRIIRIEKGKIFPLRFGETKVYAGYSGIKSLPANIKIIFTWDWLIYMVIKWTFFLFLGVAAMFTLLYALTEKKKNDLKNSLDKNPAEFIVNIYGNIKEVLAIFDLSYKESMPPLSYAELVQKSYSIENNLFLRLTVKFEEARYSGHILSSREASSALNEYNDFLKILFLRHNKFSLFLKYGLALLRRTPFFIPAP